MKRTGYTHAKFKLAARDLGISLAHMRGIVVSLWLEAAERFPAGDVGRYTNEQLTAAIDEPDLDPDRLVEVLLKRGLLDPLPEAEGRLYVHDWHDHCEDYTRQTLRNRKMAFANGAPVYGSRKAESPEAAPGAEQASTEAHSRPQRSTENHREEQESTEKHSRVMPKSLSALEPVPEKLLYSAPARAREEPRGPEVPGTMPDGTLRLDEAQVAFLEEAAREFTGRLTVDSESHRLFRELFHAGLSPPLARQVMAEKTARKQEEEPGWQAGSLKYFAKACREALNGEARAREFGEQLRQEVQNGSTGETRRGRDTGGEPGGARGSRPGGGSSRNARGNGAAGGGERWRQWAPEGRAATPEGRPAGDGPDPQPARKPGV